MRENVVETEDQDLIERASKCRVPVDDLMTVDGQAIAWVAQQDFRVWINGVLREFRGGDRIRDRHLIEGQRNGRCSNCASLKSEVWQRVTAAEAAKPAEKSDELLALKPGFRGVSLDLKATGRWVHRRLRRRRHKG
jgi:hypothetical protein